MPGSPFARFNGISFVRGGTPRRWDGAHFHPPRPGVLDPDAGAYLAAADITDGDEMTALNTYVLALKADGNWPRLQAAYPFMGDTAEQHKWNLKDPRDLNAAWRITWHGAGVHSANGYQLHGDPADYGDTHYLPSDNAILDDSHLSIYSRTNSVGGAQCDMGAYDAGQNIRYHLIIRYDNDAFYPGLGERGSSNVPSTDSRGLFASSRSDMATQVPYHNGASLGAMTVPADSLPALPIFIGRLDDFPAGPSARQYCFMSMGRSLTDQQNADLYGATQALQAALGRGV